MITELERAVRRDAVIRKVRRIFLLRRRQRPNPGWWLR